MKRWAFVTVLLYAVALVGLIAPVAMVAFGPDIDLGLVFGLLPLWFWLPYMVLAEAIMLALPVRLGRGRPVTRIWLFWPILAGAMMTILLGLGMGYTVWEVVVHAWGSAWKDSQGLLIQSLVIAAVGGFWLAWAVAFGFYTGRTEPQQRLGRIVRWLLAGSILELLVAIPAHVYARHKDSCCGGVGTVWGLGAGIAVMLFAFGPGVFVLFTRRLRSIQSKRKAANDSAEPLSSR